MLKIILLILLFIILYINGKNIQENLLYDNRSFDELEARQLLIRDYPRRLQTMKNVQPFYIPTYLAYQMKMD